MLHQIPISNKFYCSVARIAQKIQLGLGVKCRDLSMRTIPQMCARLHLTRAISWEGKKRTINQRPSRSDHWGSSEA